MMIEELAALRREGLELEQLHVRFRALMRRILAAEARAAWADEKDGNR